MIRNSVKCKSRDPTFRPYEIEISLLKETLMNKKNVEILFSLWEGGRARVLYYRGFGPARGQMESSCQTVGRYNRIGFLLTNYLITLLSIIEQYC